MVDQSADLVTKEFLRAELAEVDGRNEARFAQVDVRFARMDVRFAQVDQKIDKLRADTSVSFAQVEQKLTAQIGEVDKRLGARIDSLAVEVHKGFRRQQSWTVGVLVAIAACFIKLIFFS